jgi:CubicO group peptidase (beta-lactamase class C family)
MSVATAVHGSCDSTFRSVQGALEANLESGEELGASIAVDIDGETVVDLWGGWRDEARTQAWDQNTIVNVWSTTKTVTSLAVLMLASRGQVDVHAPVARYWPEFGAAGKDRVEVRHLMSHTSGVSGLDQPAIIEDLYDWETSTARMAAQAPWWEPGTASGYHALNFGHLLGEVVRRVTGKSLKHFAAEEIAGPLGADFQIGVAAAEYGRIAPVVPPPPLPFDLAAMDPTSPVVRTFTGPPIEAAVANTTAWRAADIGATNGHGNARSVARILSAVTLGGRVDDRQLLSSDAISLIFEQQSDGVDLVLGLPLRFGIGFGLPQTDTIPYIPTGRVCFWGGWGGSSIVMDLDRRLTFSYMMNRMGPGIIGSTRTESYLRALYGALAVPLPDPAPAAQAASV